MTFLFRSCSHAKTYSLLPISLRSAATGFRWAGSSRRGNGLPPLQSLDSQPVRHPLERIPRARYGRVFQRLAMLLALPENARIGWKLLAIALLCSLTPSTVATTTCGWVAGLGVSLFALELVLAHRFSRGREARMTRATVRSLGRLRRRRRLPDWCLAPQPHYALARRAAFVPRYANMNLFFPGVSTAERRTGISRHAPIFQPRYWTPPLPGWRRSSRAKTDRGCLGLSAIISLTDTTISTPGVNCRCWSVEFQSRSSGRSRSTKLSSSRLAQPPLQAART